MFFVQKTHAAVNVNQNPQPVYSNNGTLTLTFTNDTQPFQQGDDFTFILWSPGKTQIYDALLNITVQADGNGAATVVVTDIKPNNSIFGAIGTWKYRLWRGKDLINLNPFTPQNPTELLYEGSYEMYQACGTGTGKGCPSLALDSSVFPEDSDITLNIKNTDPNETYAIWFHGDKTTPYGQLKFPEGDTTMTINAGKEGQKRICMQAQGLQDTSTIYYYPVVGVNCDFHVNIRVVKGLVTSSAPVQSNPTGIPTGPAVSPSVTPTGIVPPPSPPCSITENGQCKAIKTALGDISVDPQDFVRKVFAILLSLAGGIALALIIFSGYKIMTSQGNEEAVKGAKETITSAIVGLLFMIFSLVLLEIVGVDILGIPGLQ